VRNEPTAAPRVFTSLKSVAYVALVSAGGPDGRARRSILRQGTRRFVGQVISPHGESALPHDHDHGDDHDPHHEGETCCEVPA